ncbi:MAG: hypothetical protein QOD85_1852 [Gaiellaceae bacterium]|nr:hypothetical protein [Gaiellaceae bacterium]
MPRATGPANVVRVGLAAFRWPLDPARATGRDETTLARALYATPLRTDARTGAVVPGLCTAWRASADFRHWTFTCKAAPSIAAALRRVKQLRDAPARWLFADARISAPAATTLSIRLPWAWRRFPYALTVVGAAPRFVPGPFELVSGNTHLVVIRREGLTVRFALVSPLAAVRQFRNGELDEAPIPLGDIVATKADRRLGPEVRARTLLGLDAATIHGFTAELRRIYWDTANRGDYEQLVSELAGSSAFGVIGGEQADPAAYRRALRAIPALEQPAVRLDVPADPALRSGARLLWAQWRDSGLGPRLVSGGNAQADGSLQRVIAAYPQEEALPAQLVLGDSAAPRGLLLSALGAAEQGADLLGLDAQLRLRASAIPIAWVVDARLVSPRLEGWREDALGNVDYAAVRSPASSPRP